MNFKGFVLDKFQEDSVNAVEKNHSVLVSAPTGSGKTLIADYIIDRDIKEDKRIIYTAPIKALSNQKFKDFTEAYGPDKIGLITGDIVINSSAPVLIMTEEIYRNMAIINDPILNNVSYCIMDEVHYISDEERGYIWEESIIFSPPHIRFLFLSATIPNAEEFAAWVESVKKHKVIMIRHDIRPVPLERKFYDSELGVTTLDSIKEKKELDRYPEYGRHGRMKRQRPNPPDFRELVSDLKQEGMLPCIYFVFSRAKTQEFAVELAKKIDFLNPQEKQKVLMESGAAFRAMSADINSLRSVHDLKQCLARGVGFHNAGMLPDVKHLVEKLFGMGLLKVLFATETFAVGINMPAKTVCFDSLFKMTNTGFRYLNSKEYFQMAGRAGRRGIDPKGLAIAVIYRPSADIQKIENFTRADVDPLKSQFKLTYNTVLNMIHLHSQEEVQKILMMNFYTFQQTRGKSKHVLGAIKGRFTKLVKQLEKLGYIKDGKLTDIGVFATKIFSDELEVSQMFAGDFKYKLDERTILLLISALVYEPRGRIQFYNTTKPDKHLLSAIMENRILQRGHWHDSLELMTAFVEPMAKQKKFLEMIKNTSMPEGDVIRLLLRIMDKLEQVDRALAVYDDRVETVRNCKGLIKNCLQGIHVF